MTNKKVKSSLFQITLTNKRVVLLSVLLILFTYKSFAQLQIATALCENKINPTGIVLQKIHFGWELQSTENGQYQTAYQLVIASSKDKLAAGNYDVYNSEIKKSTKSVLVEYTGNALHAAQIYFWKLQVEGAVADVAGNNLSLPVILQLTSLHFRNANPVNGSFECSNPLFNRIYTLINWAIKSNMQSVITDCSHREKLSWLEQDYLMGNRLGEEKTISYNSILAIVPARR